MTNHPRIRIAVILLALVSTTACSSVYTQGRRDYPNYPNYPSSPNGRGSRGGHGGYQDIAHSQGFEDGHRRGVDAARDGERHDVRRENWYRSADRGYDRRYGSRSDYRQAYRDAFTRGYNQGFRDARYRERGRYRRR